MISDEIREEAANLLSACQSREMEPFGQRNEYEWCGATIGGARVDGWSREAVELAEAAWVAVPGSDTDYTEAECLIRSGWSPGEDVEDY